MGYPKYIHRTPPEERFWPKVEKTDTCWIWNAGTNRKGYGVFMVDRDVRKDVLAHRYSYELTNGPIPEGLFICHKCDNPPCVNPDHLYAGTVADNARDAVERGRLNPLRGADSPRAKYTPEFVRELRRLRAEGAGVRELGRRFGMHSSTVSHICSGKRWPEGTA